jgi:hypothetical protein
MRRGLIAGLVVAMLALPAAAGAVIPQKGKYTGTTTESSPSGTPLRVDIKISHGGIKLKRFAIAWTAPCDSGFSTLGQATRAVGVLSSRGKFHGSGNYQSSGGNLAGTQYTAQIKSKLKGQFVGVLKAKGTFQATAVVTDTSTGAPVSTCTSPTIHWRAKHL